VADLEFKYSNTLSQTKRSAQDFFLSTILGLIWTWATFGGLTRLDPKNVSWISGDNLMSYIAQLFFIDDKWRFPFLTNPSYGTELSTSLTYTGPAPLIGLTQKLLNIPSGLQFFGLWVLINYVLQVYFSLKIANELSLGRTIGFLFSFLLLTPFLFFKTQAHLFLISHFLILWALSICVRYFLKGNISLKNVISVLVLSYLVNTYIFAMVLIILLYLSLSMIICDPLNRVRNLRFISILLTLPPLMVLMFDGFGRNGTFYESLISILSSTYGAHPFNLLSMINPDTGMNIQAAPLSYAGDKSTNFSSTGISMGNTLGAYEGFSYLGLGGILFIISSLLVAPLKLKAKLIDKRWMIGLVFVSLIFIFSVTYRVGFGSAEITLPFPMILRWAFSIFRGSGRFIWILSYLGLILALIRLSKHQIKRNFSYLLIICAIFQLSDVSLPLLRHSMEIKAIDKKQIGVDSSANDILKDISKGMSKVKVWPQSNGPLNWQYLNYSAWKHGLETDALEESQRFNNFLAKRIEEQTFRELCHNEMKTDVLYAVAKIDAVRLRDCDFSGLQRRLVGSEMFYWKTSNS